MFEASHWSEMIRLESLISSLPPCLRKKTIEELEQMKDDPGTPPTYPIHSQSVERVVKLVTEAAKHHYNWDKRHQEIISIVKSRKDRGRFETIKDYPV